MVGFKTQTRLSPSPTQSSLWSTAVSTPSGPEMSLFDVHVGGFTGLHKVPSANVARAPTNPGELVCDSGAPEGIDIDGFIASIGQVVIIEARICIEPADVE